MKAERGNGIGTRTFRHGDRLSRFSRLFQAEHRSLGRAQRNPGSRVGNTKVPEISAEVFAWTDGMLALIDYISNSRLSSELYAWTSMFDLCITQTPATYPYSGPFLQVSPLPDTGKVEFRYVDTEIKQQQWHRVVEAKDAASCFEQFVQEQCWPKAHRH